MRELWRGIRRRVSFFCGRRSRSRGGGDQNVAVAVTTRWQEIGGISLFNNVLSIFRFEFFLPLLIFVAISSIRFWAVMELKCVVNMVSTGSLPIDT